MNVLLLTKYSSLKYPLSTHLISHLGQVRLQVLLRAVQEPVVLHVRGAEGEDVDGGQAGLLPGRHVHHHWLLGGVLHDGVVGRLGHGHDAGRIVGDVETL